MNKIEQLCRKLYLARRAVKVAKKKVQDLAAKIGSCERPHSQGGIYLNCYQSNFSEDQWCHVCKEKLPAWMDYHAKANAAAGALRALMSEAAKLEICEDCGQSYNPLTPHHLLCKKPKTLVEVFANENPKP